MSAPGRLPPGRRDHAPAPDPQVRIAALRSGVLGGRGPGASATELAAHQRQRFDLGGLPVTVAREHLALVTDHARDAPVDQSREHAAARLAPLARPQWGRRPSWPAAGFALVLAALLGFAAARRGRCAPR